MTVMNIPAEAQLIDQCRRGDADAWETLFDRYYAPVARFVFQLASDFSIEDVEEICQNTFLTVINSLGSFRGKSQLQTWLFRIAANKAHDYRERQLAAKRGGGQPPLPLGGEPTELGEPIDPATTVPGPDASLERAERLALVGQSLQQLDVACRELIELRYFGDLSYEQISQTLEVHPKTVSSRLSRCLDRLEGLVRNRFARENIEPFSV